MLFDLLGNDREVWSIPLECLENSFKNHLFSHMTICEVKNDLQIFETHGFKTNYFWTSISIFP
jgi:hypothetical protein